MADFLSRLAERTLGLISVAQPIITPAFASRPDYLGDSQDSSVFDNLAQYDSDNNAASLASEASPVFSDSCQVQHSGEYQAIRNFVKTTQEDGFNATSPGNLHPDDTERKYSENPQKFDTEETITRNDKQHSFEPAIKGIRSVPQYEIDSGETDSGTREQLQHETDSGIIEHTDTGASTENSIARDNEQHSFKPEIKSTQTDVSKDETDSGETYSGAKEQLQHETDPGIIEHTDKEDTIAQGSKQHNLMPAIKSIRSLSQYETDPGIIEHTDMRDTILWDDKQRSFKVAKRSTRPDVLQHGIDPAITEYTGTETDTESTIAREDKQHSFNPAINGIRSKKLLSSVNSNNTKEVKSEDETTGYNYTDILKASANGVHIVLATKHPQGNIPARNPLSDTAIPEQRLDASLLPEYPHGKLKAHPALESTQSDHAQQRPKIEPATKIAQKANARDTNRSNTPYTRTQKDTILVEKPISVRESASSKSTIKVNIGSIEVRSISPPATSPQPAIPPARPALSLDDYLKQRNG